MSSVYVLIWDISGSRIPLKYSDNFYWVPLPATLLWTLASHYNGYQLVLLPEFWDWLGKRWANVWQATSCMISDSAGCLTRRQSQLTRELGGTQQWGGWLEPQGGGAGECRCRESSSREEREQKHFGEALTALWWWHVVSWIPVGLWCKVASLWKPTP